MSASIVPKRRIFISFVSFTFCMIIMCITYLSSYNYRNVRSIFSHANQDKTDANNAIYLVHTSSCKILQWSPFDEEIWSMYENRTGQKLDCRNQRSIPFKINRINETSIKIINLIDDQIPLCYASAIFRDELSDDKIYFGPSIGPINETTQFNYSIIKVNCTLITNSFNISTYEEIIPLISHNEHNAKKVVNDKVVNENLPNVLMIGLDSISRLNFERHFPFTQNLFNEKGFYSLYGYTKIADNTFVNIVPLLTGNFVDTFWNESISHKIFLDSFPFIWKEFEKMGYVTLLAEDAPNMGTFNYLKRGFKSPPSHYYLRPFSLSIEENVKNHCYSNKVEIEMYYDYLHDFILSMNKKKQKYFALMFLARLTHDELNNAGFADIPLWELMSKLFDNQLLNNTIIVFFSDHGLRFGPIRETFIGKIEERLPVMDIYLPNEVHKEIHRNVSINQHRLTSPFDIHATLKHIVLGHPDRDLKYGLSLFEEIPENRRCDDAKILEHWCMCQQSTPVDDLQLITPMAEYLINTLNMILEPHKDVCDILKLDRVLSAYQQHINDKVLRFQQSVNDVINRHVIFSDESEEYIKHFLVTFTSKGAIFEATVKVNEFTNIISLIGDISRINRYGTVKCINNSYLQKYCLCKSFNYI